MIQARNLAKRYASKRAVQALQGVSLDVARGEMVAIMGPSGCGKSTFLNIIGGLDRPTEGSILVDGIDLNGLDDNALARLRRRKIGFIFQFFNLLSTLTALDNVALQMHLAGIRGKEAARRSADLLKTVGLEDRLDHLPDELSGGEQQRVAIARALALQPPVILADEPTGNLDSESAKQVLSLLGQVREQFGATVVMMTHDPTAAGSCNRILSMRDGRFTDGGS